jgi:hypothetical protein
VGKKLHQPATVCKQKLFDFWLSLWWVWRWLSSGMLHHVGWFCLPCPVSHWFGQGSALSSLLVYLPQIFCVWLPHCPDDGGSKLLWNVSQNVLYGAISQSTAVFMNCFSGLGWLYNTYLDWRWINSKHNVPNENCILPKYFEGTSVFCCDLWRTFCGGYSVIRESTVELKQHFTSEVSHLLIAGDVNSIMNLIDLKFYCGLLSRSCLFACHLLVCLNLTVFISE